MRKPGSERLRDWFEGLQDIDGDGERCPQAERIRESAEERLDAAENETLMLHLAGCGACAASWRLARELLVPEAAAARPEKRVALRPWWIGLAAAAVVVMAVGVVVLQRPDRPGVVDPIFREATVVELATGIDPDTPLSRDALVLRWTGAPAGSTYDLRVTTERLEPLYRAFGLEVAEHRVPPDSLSAVEPDSVVLWSVTARLPDGRRVPPVTFRATVD